MKAKKEVKIKRVCKNCRFFSAGILGVRNMGVCLNEHTAVIDDEFMAKDKRSIYLLNDSGFDDTVMVGRFYGCRHFKNKGVTVDG